MTHTKDRGLQKWPYLKVTFWAEITENSAQISAYKTTSTEKCIITFYFSHVMGGTMSNEGQHKKKLDQPNIMKYP